jgi:hypothetical protein
VLTRIGVRLASNWPRKFAPTNVATNERLAYFDSLFGGLNSADSLGV